MILDTTFLSDFHDERVAGQRGPAGLMLAENVELVELSAEIAAAGNDLPRDFPGDPLIVPSPQPRASCVSDWSRLTQPSATPRTRKATRFVRWNFTRSVPHELNLDHPAQLAAAVQVARDPVQRRLVFRLCAFVSLW